MKTLRSRRAPRALRAIATHLEALEPRALLASIVWDGGGGDGLWSNPLNWQGDTLPQTGDDATITLAAGAPVLFNASAGSVNLNSLTINSAAFILAGGALSVANAFTLNSAGLTYSGGTLAGSPLIGSGGLTLSGGTSPVTFTLAAASIVQGTLLPGQTLWVRGQGGFGNANAALNGDLLNRGTILLESITAGFTSQLSTNLSTLTIAPEGTIAVNLGTGGGRNLTGNVVNAGTIVTAADAALTISGDYTAAGGRIDGPALIANSTIRFSAPATTPSTLVAPGANTLATDLTPGYTLWVRGQGGFGNADLTIPQPTTNHGTLRLESINGGFRARLLNTSGFPLTNAPGGTIAVNTGTAGERTIQGPLANQGSIALTGPTTLSILGAFTQSSGTTAAGPDGTVLISNAPVTLTGGALTGTVALAGGAVTIASTVTTPSTLRVFGVGNNLIANDAPAFTIEVLGRSVFGSADLVVANDAFNRGTIRLNSTDGGFRARIVTDAAATLTNTAGASILSLLGAGGARDLIGRFTNAGTIAAADDAGLFISGTLTAAGGVLTGPVIVNNTLLRTTLPSATPSSITLVGLNTLEGDVAPGYTLWVRGQNSFGNAELTSTGQVANRGTLRLESINGGFRSRFTLAAGTTLTNEPTGTILANAGAGGERSIVGTLLNRGTFATEAGTLTQVFGEVALAAGAVSAGENAEVRFENAPFTFTGGTVSGTVGVVGGPQSTIDVGPAVTSTATIFVTASSRLINNASPTTTLWVRGRNGFGNAELTVTGTAVSAGTIRLESINGGIRARVLIHDNGELTIAPTGSVVANSGGVGGERSITGTLVNQGQLLATDTGLSFNGSYTGAGGTTVGPVLAFGSTIAFTAPATSPNTLVTAGANTLTTGIAAGYTLWARGQNGFGNADLTITTNAPSPGTLRLGSVDGAFRSRAIAPAGYTVAPGGTLLVTRNAGGPRELLGNLTNNGLVSIDAATTLTVFGNYTQAQAATLLVGLTSDTAFGRLNVTSAADFDGIFSIDLANDYFPLCGTEYLFVTAGSVVGAFSERTTPSPGQDQKFVLLYTPTTVSFKTASTADYNEDGILNPDDLSDYITAYFTLPQDPAIADFNGDGIVNPDDLSDFITIFFLAC